MVVVVLEASSSASRRDARRRFRPSPLLLEESWLLLLRRETPPKAFFLETRRRFPSHHRDVASTMGVRVHRRGGGGGHRRTTPHHHNIPRRDMRALPSFLLPLLTPHSAAFWLFLRGGRRRWNLSIGLHTHTPNGNISTENEIQMTRPREMTTHSFSGVFSRRRLAFLPSSTSVYMCVCFREREE